MLAPEKFFFNERASVSPGKLLQILGLRGAVKPRTGSGGRGWQRVLFSEWSLGNRAFEMDHA